MLPGNQAPALNQFLQTAGGVSGLAEKSRLGGAADVFSSWGSFGENKQITADTISRLLGSAQVQEFAKTMGVDPSQASGFIAQALPQRIDKLTPTGQTASTAS